MRVVDLIRILETCSPDAEIRVIADVIGGDYTDNRDLPIVGVTADHVAAELLPVPVTDGPQVLWIVTSCVLRPWPKPPEHTPVLRSP